MKEGVHPRGVTTAASSRKSATRDNVQPRFFGAVIVCGGCGRRFRQSPGQRFAERHGQTRFFCRRACVTKDIFGEKNKNHRHGFQTRAFLSVIADVVANRRIIRAIQEQVT